jgi:opacity protein-like surface antigen
MDALKRSLSTLLLVCALPAFAQEDWKFTISPTLWGAGMSGAVQIGPKEDKIRVDFSDTFGLSDVGGMLSFEANNGRLGVMVEGIYVDASGDADPPGITTEIADASVEHQIWSIASSYRFRDARPRVDAVIGFRYMDANADIRILTGGTVVRQAVESEDWLDFTFGARVGHEINETWSAVGHFDFGVGDTKLSYQLILGMGYRFSPAVSATFGFRMISADYVIRVKSETTPPAPIVMYHYGSMKLGGPYAGLQFTW